MRRVKFTFIVLFLVTIMSSAYAQSGWNWPEDKKTAEEKVVLYTDLMKSDKFMEARKPLQWLLQNTPDLNPSIYINGVKIYEALADAEKDAKKQIVFADSALLLYDLRIKYFNDEANVINRKAYAAYKYQIARKDKYDGIFNLFKRAFELNGNSTLDINCVIFMDFMNKYKAAGAKITDEEIFDNYDLIMQVLDNAPQNARILKFKEQVDEILVRTIEVDCNFVEQNFGPKFEANPEDVKLAKKIYQLLSTGKCSDSPLYIKVLVAVQKSEPSYGIAKVLGIKYKVSGEYDKSLKYYQEALTLTDENTKKADIYLEIGDVHEKKGAKPSARDAFLKAVSVDPSRKEAYSLIGNLYFNSAASSKDCPGENVVYDRAVFIAAYEMFKRAGNTSGMKSAEAQFPSMEDIFNHNLEVGQSIKVGCWINETVVLQRRQNAN